MFLLASFAVTALVLAVLGVYGVIAYYVRQRTYEIGVRMALGAGRGQIVGMVVREGMVMALIGIGAGAVAALGLTHVIGTLLFDVKPNDPLTFAAALLALTATALLASWGPALKAARVDPLLALHYE